MNDMSIVSFIILTHNSESYVINCLNSILEQDYLEKEIIIVDNNSTDKTWELLNNFKIKNSIKINVIKNKSNLGYNLGNLEGIKKSTGKFIALINPDVILTKNWTSEIIQKFRDDLTTAVCGKILNFDNSIQSTGGQLDIYCTPQQRKNSNLFVNEDFFYITGAAFVFTKSLLTKLELDPFFQIYVLTVTKLPLNFYEYVF